MAIEMSATMSLSSEPQAPTIGCGGSTRPGRAPDVRARYAGETRFPFVIQNFHRYFLYLATIVLAFLWWDTILAFNFDGRFGIGLGSIVMLANVLLLTGYTLSCHSVRYLVGGYLDSFHGRSLRFRLWSFANRMNARHSRWAWASLIVV